MTHNNTQHTGLGRLEIWSRHVFSWKAGEPFPFRRYFGGKQGQRDTLHFSGAVSLGAPGHQMIVTSTNIQRWILTKHLLK